MGKELKDVMDGKAVKGRKAEMAAEQAARKIRSLEGAKARAKELMDGAVGEAIFAVEGTATLAAASAAEGYFGDKLKLGGKVDARPAIGIPVFLTGLALGASKKTGTRKVGRHLRALSGGVVTSWVASAAVKGGQKLAASRNASTTAGDGGTSTTGDDTPDLRVIDGGALPDVGADLRDILLTDPASSTSGAPRASTGDASSRLVRANRL